jgi:uncharacterized 2Fe-2S/4Fe-4S cluster protein (DUF4445 family)
MADVIHAGSRRPASPGRSLFDYADELSVVVPASCRRSGRCHECVVEIRRGADSLSSQTVAESFLRHGYRLACQATVEDDREDIEFAVLRRRLRILTGAGGGIEPTDPPVQVRHGVVHHGDEPLEPVRDHVLGLAMDLGTTTIVVELVDLRSGGTMAVTAFENPQRFGGSDVMARISYDAAIPGELRQAVRKALNHELRRVYAELGIDRREVYELVVVGNTTMRDLFFGLDVQPIGRRPFRSVTETAVREGRSTSTALTRLAHELGILIHPRGRVWGGPIVACHVGADVAADLVAVGLVDGGPPAGISVLIDIGTNTEIVVGDGRRFVAASSPAGPAFEGGLVSHGMPGAVGAIESVRRDGAGFAWRTIGDVAPEGICGSGLIDLLAVLRQTDRMSPNGAFAGGVRTLTIVPQAEITFSRADASQLAQAKASNVVAQELLLREAGIAPAEVGHVFLAGAFANSIDPRHAIEIGFLAPFPVERIERAGNASIRGASALLLSASRRERLERFVREIHHVELESEPDFFDLFVDGCRFLPLRGSTDNAIAGRT